MPGFWLVFDRPKAWHLDYYKLDICFHDLIFLDWGENMIHYTANNPNKADGSGGEPDERPFEFQPYSRINIGLRESILIKNDLSLSSVEGTAIVRDALSPDLYRKPDGADTS